MIKLKIWNKKEKKYEELSGNSLHIHQWWVVDAETGDPMICIQPIGSDNVQINNMKDTHIAYVDGADCRGL